ncbi:DNA recombination protein RmuC [uncultured Eubacterium sp.]|uniref:DNA recombination protein RmuC n=1 Tax=uncultured Eubacterium sp. TaxID=165185 RepID=UPI0025FE2983|nr:DNA recombination protein RmuC [uncultured Eubacterium sp.]
MIMYIMLGACIVLLLVLIILSLTQSKGTNSARLEELSRQMNELVNKNYEQQVKIMETLNDNNVNQTKFIQQSILSMQEGNEKKLEQMRETVDEKLTSTLNKRINASFEQVSTQLTNVYQSLGEMKELSSGVTGLNKILTNVKTRGTWAELQLDNILEQIIPNMYERNVKTNPKYNGQVEFAVKIPNADNDEISWLPIDSKFPMEDYIRLTDAGEQGNIEAVDRAQKALEQRVKEEARAIKNYINEPYTTPFAIMYLATEGLYAQIMNSPTGLPERLQEMGILVAGPSTITALLNSLQLGFSTIAINKRANEVWKILGNAKKQYDLFGELLLKAQTKIDEAGKIIGKANERNEIIKKNLKKVNELESNVSQIELLE